MCNFPTMSGYADEGIAYGSQRVFVERWYTPHGVTALFRDLVPPTAVDLEVFGNRLAVACYANRVAAEAVGRRPLLQHDRYWPVLICATVTKPENWTPALRTARASLAGIGAQEDALHLQHLVRSRVREPGLDVDEGHSESLGAIEHLAQRQGAVVERDQRDLDLQPGEGIQAVGRTIEHRALEALHVELQERSGAFGHST